MNKLPKAWKWIIGAWVVILLATLTFKYFTDWRYPVPSDSQTIIRLSKWTSFPGTRYNIIIYGDGTVVFYGEMFVGSVGIRKTKIDVEKVKELMGKIEQVGFFSFEDSYFPKGIYDANGVTVNVKVGQREKEVTHIDLNHDLTAIVIFGSEFEPASNGVPDSLYSIENSIIGIANADQWINCKFENPVFCGFSPLALIANLFIFGLTLWLVWKHVKKGKAILSSLFGFGILLVHGAVVVIANLSFPTKILAIQLIRIEFILLMPVTLFFVLWNKRRSKAMESLLS